MGCTPIPSVVPTDYTSGLPTTSRKLPIVRASDLYKFHEQRGEHVSILRVVDLEAGAGEFVCVMGPRGPSAPAPRRGLARRRGASSVHIRPRPLASASWRSVISPTRSSVSERSSTSLTSATSWGNPRKPPSGTHAFSSIIGQERKHRAGSSEHESIGIPSVLASGACDQYNMIVMQARTTNTGR